METATDTAPQDDYGAFLQALRDRFGKVTAGGEPLFTTDAAGLWDAFLAALPEHERQPHTCAACRRFVEGYGGLVTISAKGHATPVLWDAGSVPGLYTAAVRAVERIVARAAVTGVFLTSESVWGRPVTADPDAVGGEWRHMAVAPPAALVYRASPVKTAFQASAEKREDYGTLERGLADFPAKLCVQAHAALSNGALYRSEKCIEVARWLVDVHAARDAAKGATARKNVTWRAVAKAPAGFCHVRSTMIGTLLEDLAAGLSFPEVKRKFDAKMHPLQYMRPQAAPSAGNIAQAEKVVAALKTAGALERRFARLSDLSPTWTPAEAPPKGGVFAHLTPKSSAAPSLDLPPIVMTWEKFARTVLPDARKLECWVPARKQAFYAFVTAANPDAPPIVQWDREDRRNPVTWYTYNGGSEPSQWGLPADVWHPVTAVSLFPHQWGGPGFERHGDGVLFVLAGAKDSQTTGLCLFPEFLRSEYHAVRATIEAHSKGGEMAGREEAGAGGLGVRKGQSWDLRVRVTPRSGPPTVYQLDRWD